MHPSSGVFEGKVLQEIPCSELFDRTTSLPTVGMAQAHPAPLINSVLVVVAVVFSASDKDSV